MADCSKGDQYLHFILQNQMPKTELTQISHTAEVNYKTALNQWTEPCSRIHQWIWMNTAVVIDFIEKCIGMNLQKTIPSFSKQEAMKQKIYNLPRSTSVARRTGNPDWYKRSRYNHVKAIMGMKRQVCTKWTHRGMLDSCGRDCTLSPSSKQTQGSIRDHNALLPGENAFMLALKVEQWHIYTNPYRLCQPCDLSLRGWIHTHSPAHKA